MTACFIVRAQVVDANLRNDFDRWYQDEHLPQALEAFNARRAWRGWSEVDASLHYAFYQFDHVTQARAIADSAALERLAIAFDRRWGENVTRSREIVEAVQSIDA
jgi:hypothetical protein